MPQDRDARPHDHASETSHIERRPDANANPPGEIPSPCDPASSTTLRSATHLEDAETLAAAWDQFYDHCFRIIQRSGAVRGLSQADREDCVQEVMIEIVRKFGAVNPEAIEEEHLGWIKTVSRNKAADIVRRKTRRSEVAFDDGSGALITDNGLIDEDSGASIQDAVSIVWEALVSLDQQVPVTSYLVFYLKTIEGWSFAEIAELFQIPVGQARVRCHRVKKKFDAILQERKANGPREA